MAVMATWTGRVRDWRALRQLNHETLVAHAREIGATRYRLYRNLRDASELLLVAELPNEDAVRELARALSASLGALVEGGSPDDRTWEVAGFEEIG